MADERHKPLRVMPGDRYVDFKPAGAGGMGVVYWALDTELNREVAFKVVRPEGDDPAPAGPAGLTAPARDTPSSKAFETLTNRFLQEAWVTGGLAHPGIVPVYELGQTEAGVPYYTMRFVRGERTLSSALEEMKGQPFEERIQLLEPFLKVCDTIRYAHAKGVVHRDLKPENVALGEFGEVVVLDWGLAKLQGEKAGSAERWQRRVEAYREATDLKTMASVGTPGYMAPEAIRGAADERGDVYALGAMLYEILTGRLPHTFESVAEYVSVVRTPAEPARAVEPDVPEALSEITRMALAVEPEVRLENVRSLADAVRDWRAQSALDREVENLLREAEAKMQAAEDASGETRLRQADRAAAALAQVATKRPASQRAEALSQRAAALREQGIRERTKASTRRLLVRGGFAVLAVATAVAFLVAGAVDRKAREAERERNAKAAALLEKSRALDEVLRLSDAKKVRDLLRQADTLWPIRADRASAMADWLERARAVIGHRADHEVALARVRDRMVPYSDAERALQHGEALARLAAIGRRLDAIDREAEAEEAEALLQERNEIEVRTRGRLTHEDAWRQQVLTDLLRGLATLEGDRIAEILERFKAASTLSRRSVEDLADAWADTAEGIATSNRYGGLRIAPHEGLVPLGPDPDSGLYEFAHMGSGTIPARDAESKQLSYADDAAIVLVLVPGGADFLGAQRADPSGGNFDPAVGFNESPVHLVTLSPFFLAKHECTQAQWAALTAGQRPSQRAIGQRVSGRVVTERNPVEQVSWEECDRWLGRHRLALPSEAQWEYACRAGTDTPWSSGSQVKRLGKVANVADAYLKASGAPADWAYTEEVDDGYGTHAPVGSLAPNDFGLFDMHGNVFEWCLDVYGRYRMGPGSDPVAAEGSGNRVARGGAWNAPARYARSANRRGIDPADRSSSLGVRPAGAIRTD